MMDFRIRRWMLDWATTASDVTCKFPCGYEVYNYKLEHLKLIPIERDFLSPFSVKSVDRFLSIEA